MLNPMSAHHEWMRRPADERFTSLPSLLRKVDHIKTNSEVIQRTSRDLQVRPIEGDRHALEAAPSHYPTASMSHWSFGQLASLAGAPARYLRTLPSDLAADCLNTSILQSRKEETKLMVYSDPDKPDTFRLSAATGVGYGRIWNADVVREVIDRFGDGVTGRFRVPGEFGVALDRVTQDNTTLFASDQDMFLFLADEQNRITVPDRRDGKSGELARGFMIGNSEVGAGTLRIATFLFDFVCQNRIVWGSSEWKEIRIRHTSKANDRWLHEIMPAINSYANAETRSITDAVAAAQLRRVDEEKMDELLYTRFSRPTVDAIKKVHMLEEHRPIETVWDAITGATAYAKGVTHQDARIDIETKAGKLFDLVR